ncbi:MAG: flagellar basal body-associated protein FliL [Spirochaetales bacterium]|nr:flagellar basal body-associated protein FliL [Spirochaetales bacterium]
MADDDVVFGEDEVAEGPGAEGPRGGFLPEIVIKILKIVAMALVAIIFIVTVVIVTMKIMTRGTVNQSYPASSPEYAGEPDILLWYDGIEEIRTRTADANPMTVIVKIMLGYEKNNNALTGELVQRQPPFQAKIRAFFGRKVASELTAKNEEALRQELKETINRDLTTGKIMDVIIMNLQVLDF